MRKFLVPAVGVAALLTACGDETRYTPVSVTNENVPVVGKLDKSTVCDKDADGKILYVRDKASYFLCDGDEWVALTPEGEIDTVKVRDTVKVHDTVSVSKGDSKVDTVVVLQPDLVGAFLL
ncbi:MAG: hypothetical protein MJY87_06025 [Fibrobacter sp.]|nr:hypothetical protein [Fibrobacter sp.]